MKVLGDAARGDEGILRERMWDMKMEQMREMRDVVVGQIPLRFKGQTHLVGFTSKQKNNKPKTDYVVHIRRPWQKLQKAWWQARPRNTTSLLIREEKMYTEMRKQ